MKLSEISEDAWKPQLLHAQLSQDYESDDGYICKEARTRQKAKQLFEKGFEYVMEKDGVSLFRKLK